ncbi:MAG: nicotinamidase-related amidase [Chlamydiales bacterium]|jgi:nicotinamidase-related amidase
MKVGTKFLDKKETGLLVIDVQEKLLPGVESQQEICNTLVKAIKGFQIFQLPIVVTEQYPKGLGETVSMIKNCLGDKQKYYEKTSFSCVRNPKIKDVLVNSSVSQWVLVGIEAHVCILQTAKDLLEIGKDVTILNDAVGSRSIYDFSTAIGEFRDAGVRVTSLETALFELLGDSKAPEFKAISALIQEMSCVGCDC